MLNEIGNLLRAIAIGVEFIYSRLKGVRIYNGRELWMTVLAHLAWKIWDFLAGLALSGLYIYVCRRSPFHPQLSAVASLFAAIVLIDFAYYVTHFYTHKIRLGWCAHMTHHTPKVLNQSVAYRFCVFNPLYLVWLFGAIPIWFGLSPYSIVAANMIVLFYEAIIHTPFFSGNRWFDAIFNSPSNHRMHHALSDGPMSCNYGGIFILFDRLFGTYRPEPKDGVREFGVAEQADFDRLMNVLFYGWFAMFKDLRKARSLAAKLKITFGATANSDLGPYYRD